MQCATQTFADVHSIERHDLNAQGLSHSLRAHRKDAVPETAQKGSCRNFFHDDPLSFNFGQRPRFYEYLRHLTVYPHIAQSVPVPQCCFVEQKNLLL